MKAILIVSTMLTISVAQAATKSDAIYLDQSGRQVDAVTAIKASMSGQLTYKCNPQEFKVSKSGSSISIRNRKKKLTAEEIQVQIEELKKRSE